MKVYAALNLKNQVIKTSSLLNLIHYCKNSNDDLNIAVFRGGEPYGRIVASFDAGTTITLPINKSVNTDVLRHRNAKE